MPEGGVPRDEAGVGRACAPNPDELPGDATSEHGGDPQHDDAGSANKTSGPCHVWGAPGAGGERNHGERVRDRRERRVSPAEMTRKCEVTVFTDS